MKRGKSSTSWIFGGGLFILVMSLIVYMGYPSIVSESTQNRSKITNKKAQTVSANVKGIQEIDQRKLNNETSVGESKLDKEPLELKDFPCPVHGNPMRKVGDYYSESLGRYLFHAGADYALSEGTVIRTTQGGKVIFSGVDPLLGQKVTLDCGEGWLVTYGGLDNLRVKVGDTVEVQDALGQVGFFPGAEGVHNQPQLHYEIWHGNELMQNQELP